MVELKQKGKYSEAIEVALKALEIGKKLFGFEHPDTARSLNNLAEFYDRMGDYDRAETLYQRSLKIVEKLLGPDHPQTALALDNLAGLYFGKGDYTRAVGERLTESDVPWDWKQALLGHNPKEVTWRYSHYYKGMANMLKLLELVELLVKYSSLDETQNIGRVA